jgi:hypothetical protein
MITQSKVRTLLALGPRNLARVGLYRLGLRLGVHPVLKIAAQAPRGPYFRGDTPSVREGARATPYWRNTSFLFSHHEIPLTGVPDWHSNPFRAGARADASSHWSRIADFNPTLGDIKTVWEVSRFDWLVAMAQRASLGDQNELARLNVWLDDWAHANPPYDGANWKCGQEASIRVMHLAAAALILGEVRTPTDGLRALLRLHLARIAPTMGYAIGQQNNHGTSEAAALFIGGSWLAMHGDVAGASWMDMGRRWLEDRAVALIERDGTFSQYSVVYHRVMLDTYALAEVWRRHQQLLAFSSQLTSRLQSATRWLQQLVDPQTGDAPNLGANDGARLLPLSETGFRDFRPSLQLAAVLFLGQRGVASAGPWDQPNLWLGIDRPDQVLPPPESVSFDDGGLHVLRRGAAVAYLRYPRFRFRPSQADALHLDLWIDGVNVLRDGGTLSYGTDNDDYAYFSGTASHNTVQFDGRDQMPRLGRFLFGSWLVAEQVQPVTHLGAQVTAAAGYRDAVGARHHRTVTLGDRRLICVDRVEGNAKRAVLRWRLQPDTWRLEGSGVTNGPVQVLVTSDKPLRAGLVGGYESRHYLEKTALPVLEVECDVPSTVTTEIRF